MGRSFHRLELTRTFGAGVPTLIVQFQRTGQCEVGRTSTGRNEGLKLERALQSGVKMVRVSPGMEEGREGLAPCKDQGPSGLHHAAGGRAPRTSSHCSSADRQALLQRRAAHR